MSGGLGASPDDSA